MQTQMNPVTKIVHPSPIIKFLLGKFLSFVGDQIYLIALPLIVYEITSSPLAMGAVAAAEKLPIYFQPFAGVVADRVNRKKIMLWCDAIRGSLLLIISTLYFIHILSFWEIMISALIMGFASQLHNASGFAVIPSLVDREKLHKVNTIDEGLFNTAILLGPSLGGIIVSFYNPGIALFVNGVSFFISFVSLFAIHAETGKVRKSSRLVRTIFFDLKEGFIFVCKTKEILVTNIALIISTFGSTLFLTEMIFYMKADQKFTSEQIGLMLSIGGLGAIIGSFSSGFINNYISTKNVLIFSHFIGGASFVYFGLSSSFFHAAAANLIGVVAASAINPAIRTIRQNAAPENMMGRVQATSRFITWFFVPISALVAGVLAEKTSISFTLIIAGIISMSSIIIYILPIGRKVSF